MNSNLENGEAKINVRYLINKMRKKEIALMCLIWHKILERLSAAKKVQNPHPGLGQAVKRLKSLKTRVLN